MLLGAFLLLKQKGASGLQGPGFLQGYVFF